MSSDDRIAYPADPEKTPNADECEKQVEIFRGYSISESVGVVIDFGKIKPSFITRNMLEQELRDQEAMIVIPISDQKSAPNTVYFVADIDSRKQLTDSDDQKASTLRLLSSNGCGCPNAEILTMYYYCSCNDTGLGNGCKCENANLGICKINVCGP